MTKVLKFTLRQHRLAHHIVHGAAWVHLTGILILMHGLDVQAVNDENTVVLNSCERCQSGRENNVSSDVGYSIAVSPRADHECWWQCDAEFSSAREGGWLCLIQNGIMSHINVSNVELFVDTQNSIKKLEYYPSSWTEREMCIKTNLMTFSLKKMNSGKKIEFKKIHIQLQVLDIESKDRKLYLDESYCSTTYKLLNSQIRVINQPSEDMQVSYGDALTSLCGIPIKKLDNVVNKSICFLYQPLEQIDCRNNWMFSVSVHGHTVDPAHMVYTLKCGEEKARQTHAWCASKDLEDVTVIFQRNEGATKSRERPNMFQFIFLDYAGTAESLMEEKGLLVYGGQSSPNEEDNGTYIIYVALGVTLFAITIVCLLLFLYRTHRLSREPDRADQNGGNPPSDPSVRKKMIPDA